MALIGLEGGEPIPDDPMMMTIRLMMTIVVIMAMIIAMILVR